MVLLQEKTEVRLLEDGEVGLDRLGVQAGVAGDVARVDELRVGLCRDPRKARKASTLRTICSAPISSLR